VLRSLIPGQAADLSCILLTLGKKGVLAAIAACRRQPGRYAAGRAGT